MEQVGIKILFLDYLEFENSAFKDNLLEIYGDEIEYKKDVDEALEIYVKDASSYDLLILSFAKEDGTPLEIIKRFLSYNSALKIIVINDFNNKECIFKTIESGVNRVLLHPRDDANLKTNLHLVVEYIEQIKKLNILNLNARNCKRVVNEYKKAVDASTIFSISDLNGRIIYANRQFVKASGYTLEELRQKPHSIVRHPDTSSEIFKDLWNTIQNKEIWNGILKNRAKDGTAYYVDATIVPILDRYNNIVEYAGIRHEITELIEKTKELEDLKNKQRVEDIKKALKIRVDEVIESMPYPTIFIDEDSSKILNKNSLFLELFNNHKCLKGDEFFLTEFFEQKDGYLYSNETISFYDSYELCDDSERFVIIEIDGELREFFVGAKQKDNGIIISLVEKR
ncbi:MAG: PAS domain S-box protein [Campylobacterales bacterium]|nr:PAS domain S-box protein [Campylobacterales bacterium]